jgi:two-component system CheB/CheR fusion protein
MDADGRESPGAEAVADQTFRPLLEKLSGMYNFDFREYKEASLARRIRIRMSQAHVSTFDAYARYLEHHPQEHVALFNTILINVTGFFRDPEAWAALDEEVLPRIVADAADRRSIRMWSAGCSSGEEPYTLAMLLAERLGGRGLDFMVKIYGTDIDEEALGTARHAAYRLDQLKDVPPDLVDRYFVRDGQLYRLRRELRRWCIFGGHNLTQAPPLSHIDLLVCRNVLIYFTGELQERVLARFHYAARESGYLFLGRSESLLARSRFFTAVHSKWRIFQRVSATVQHVNAVLPDRGAEAMAAADREARAEAQSGATRLQRALDALPAAVVVIDISDTILYWNAAAEQLFEIPTINAVARKFRDLDISYRVEGLRARIEDTKARRGAIRMDDVTFARRNGDLVHIDVVVRSLMEGERASGILVFVLEATEHARLKEQMSRVAEQHATAIEELQSTNEELETTNEELQSTNEELETTNEELQSTNEELETTVEELQATNGELAALNTELEQRTAELRRFDLRHHAVLNSLEEGIVVVDRAGTIEAWNQAAERIWGLRSEQVVGRHLGHLPLGNVAAAAREAHERVLLTSRPEEVPDVPYTLPGRENRRANIRLTPLKDGAGDVIGVVGVLTPSDGGPAGPARSR